MRQPSRITRKYRDGELELMSEEPEDAGGGIGSGLLSLFVGLLVPILFNSLVQGQDVIVFIIGLVAVAGAVLYGEAFLAMPTGVALGVGILVTSFASLSWWLVGLGVVAAAFNLARDAYADSDLLELETPVG